MTSPTIAANTRPWLDPAAKPFISIRHITKRFDDVTAVNDVSLDIFRGELFCLLGGSGCGKSTLLRMLAGFEVPTAGQILIDGQDMAGVPADKRPTNMMFQSYALFPHMTVEKNVAYGLLREGKSKAEAYQRVAEMLRLVKLEQYAKRKPHQLSGGQRQRVALARALVMRPKVLLLDEPLGALDLKLREAMQEELKALQRRLGITFVFVTHDQGEALSMADRVAVFNEGKIVQVGPPREIYYRPNVSFVADFVGSSNVLPPELVQKLTGERRFAALRPEAVWIGEAGLPAVVKSASFHGANTRVVLAAEGADLVALLPKSAMVPEVGARVHLDWDAGDLHLMEGGK
ncbi:MAG: ABC transporter ATP-binding protein [Rhodobacteraceae bacterium]|nr:ABC transporter ATP-binding protein [Paracoccaceae bacterium]